MPEPSRALTIAQELGQKLPQFGAALKGTGVSPERFVRVIMTAININPDLMNCDRRSLMNAAMRAASDGLQPDGIEGALVPFEGKVTWMPMVTGIRKKVRRTGEVTSWDVTAVHQKDRFDFELGDDPFIKHKPWMPGELPRGTEESEADYNARLRRHISSGPLTFVYSVATIKGGDKSRDVMSRAEVELVRDTYARKNKKGEYSPAWRRSFDEMAKKTIARRHAKQLPMASDIVALLTRDDELYDVERERGERIQAPRDLDQRLEYLSAGVDPETGEIPLPDDGVSTPPSQERAASEDPSVALGGDGGEGAAQHFSGAESPSPGEGRDGRIADESVTSEPEPQGSQAPPGAAATPSRAPGGSPRKVKQPAAPDLLTQDIAKRGNDISLQGRQALERWVNELPPDEMAKISLAQLKAWRTVADKVSA